MTVRFEDFLLRVYRELFHFSFIFLIGNVIFLWKFQASFICNKIVLFFILDKFLLILLGFTFVLASLLNSHIARALHTRLGLQLVYNASSGTRIQQIIYMLHRLVLLFTLLLDARSSHGKRQL
jgi:hypothetical protein